MADINVTVSNAGIGFLLDGAGANAAATYAAQASASASAAAASAAAAAASATDFTATSTSSVTIGTGAKTFTVQTAKSFQGGEFIQVSSSADATQWMWGTVTSYNATTGALVVSVTVTGGAGTYASWNVSMSGAQGSGTNASTLNGKSDSAFAQVAIANTFTLAQVIAAGTVVVSTPVLDLSQTWNAGAVAFTGLKLNVTATASAASSLLMDLQVGGASKFSVDKTGLLTLASGLTVGSAITMPGASAFQFSGRGVWQATADGVFEFTNAAQTGFTRLMLGGATASFPAIKRNAAAINFRLADDSADAAIAAAAGTFSGQLIGKGTATNDNAAAGYIGERGQSVVTSASAVTLTNSANVTVTSVTLGPGDYEVWGMIHYIGDSATTVTYSQSSLDGATNTQTEFFANNVAYFSAIDGGGYGTITGREFYSVAVSQTANLNARGIFSGGGMKAYGTLYWRRMR